MFLATHGRSWVFAAAALAEAVPKIEKRAELCMTAEFVPGESTTVQCTTGLQQVYQQLQEKKDQEEKAQFRNAAKAASKAASVWTPISPGKTMPLSCASTAFVTKTLPFIAVLR